MHNGDPLTAFREHWRAALAREAAPTLVWLSGEAGRGKSHLLRRALGGEDRRVLLGAPHLLPALVGALHDRLAQVRDPALLAALRSARPDLDWPLRAEVAPPGDGGEGAEAHLAGALGLLAQERGGLLLAVDELERATPDDLRLLLTVWRTLAAQSAPALLLLAGQEVAPAWLAQVGQIAALTPGSAVHHLSLSPLDEAGMRELVAQTLGPADAELADWLLARSGGHPLWAVQLLAHLRAGGMVRPVAGVWTFRAPALGELPDNLEALLRARWLSARGGGVGDDLLDLLALAGRPLPLSELQAALCAPLDGVQAALERLEGQGLTRPALEAGQARVFLSHPSFGPVGRKALLPGREAELRGHLARTTADPDLRAQQARLAGLPEAPAWTRAALEAATARQAYHLVAEHAGALLADAALSAPERHALLATLGQAQLQLGQFREAVQTISALPDPPPELVLVQVKALMNLGDYPAALALVAGELERGDDPGLRVAEARLLAHAGKLEDARVRLDALLDLPGVDLAEARLARAHHAMLSHDAPRLKAEAEAALEHAPTAQARADALNFRGVAQVWLGEWAGAEAALRECLDLMRAAGRESSMQAVYGNLGNLYLSQSRLREAQDVQATALKLAQAGGSVLVLKNTTGNLGLTRVMLGDEGGLDHLRAWQAHYREHLPASAPYITLHTAAAHALFGADDAARSLLAAYPEEELIRHGYGPLTLAQVYLCFGDLDTASRLVEASPPYTGDPMGEIERPYYQALIQALRGDLAGAAALLRQNLAHPAMERFPAIAAEHRWALLGVRLGQGGHAAEAQALGAQVAEFLAWSGGRGHLLLFDRLFPQGRAERHALLRQNPPALRQAFLRTLGHFDLEESGEVRPWRARKVRELLALLLCAQVGTPVGAGGGLTRGALTLALWPELPEAQAEATFRKTLRRLREALGSAAQITRARECYVLSGLHADLPLFLQALQDRDLSAACAWYEGPFLPGTDLPEVVAVRESLHARWRAAALELVQEASGTAGLPLLTRVLRDDPLDQEALSLLATLPAADAAVRRLAAELRPHHLAELGEVAPEVARVLAG